MGASELNPIGGVKAIEQIAPAPLLPYWKLAGGKVGLPVHFNVRRVLGLPEARDILCVFSAFSASPRCNGDCRE